MIRVMNARGWTREFALHDDAGVIGYGSVAVAGPWSENRALYDKAFLNSRFRRAPVAFQPSQ